MQQSKKANSPWLLPLVGLAGGVIAFAAVFALSNNIIGAAGVGLIVFGVSWRSVRKFYTDTGKTT